MRLICLFAILLSSALLHGEKDGNPLKIELISEVKSIVAGQLFFMGLHLDHPTGTHTYWKNPGVVGLATTVSWDLPPGFKAGEIQWPAPQLVKMAGYLAQGYERETLLMIPITPPEKLTDSTVKITAKVSWMCCGKTCHPAVDVPFSITLAVGNAEPEPSTQPLFKQFRPRVPKPPHAWTEVSVKRDGGKIILTLVPELRQRDPFWTENTSCRFFTLDGQVDTDRKQETRTSEDGTIVMTLIASTTGPKDSSHLPGVVEMPTGKMPRWIEINPAY
jgi:DsbC/DsbD-like thiol-disulfide interchange protein